VRLWWGVYVAGILGLAVVNDWTSAVVRGLVLVPGLAYLGSLLIGMIFFGRLGSVRKNKRALYAARKNVAEGKGGRLRVVRLRVQLYLALRERKSS
jgi:hypothetical protein